MLERTWFLIVCCVFMLIGGGCALTSMLGGPESPRPKSYQVEASEKITTTTVTEVMKGQLGKQTGIGAVAIAAIAAMTSADKQFKAVAITNIVANAANAIRKADGSAKLLSQLSGRANKSISEMSALEYMAYTQSQTAVAMNNREKAMEGIKSGWEWGKKQIVGVAGAATGGGGLLALAMGMIRRGKKVKTKDSLLKSTGNGINDFAAKNPKAGKELKAILAKAASNLPVNAKAEFGVG